MQPLSLLWPSHPPVLVLLTALVRFVPENFWYLSNIPCRTATTAAAAAAAPASPVCFVPDQLLMPFKRAVKRQYLLPQLLLELPRALLPLLLPLLLQRHINVLCS